MLRKADIKAQDARGTCAELLFQLLGQLFFAGLGKFGVTLHHIREDSFLAIGFGFDQFALGIHLFGQLRPPSAGQFLHFIRARGINAGEREKFAVDPAIVAKKAVLRPRVVGRLRLGFPHLRFCIRRAGGLRGSSAAPRVHRRSIR